MKVNSFVLVGNLIEVLRYNYTCIANNTLEVASHTCRFCDLYCTLCHRKNGVSNS